jgi:acyl dehydratase
MSIDPAAATAAPAVELLGSWDADDVVRYHLALGAGAAFTDREVAYVDERRVRPLPTFSAVSAGDASARAGEGPGLDYDRRVVVHAEQALEVHAPLPPVAEVSHRARIESVYDKGSAALLTVRVDTNLVGGTALCTNRFTMFAPGAGRFGGDPGPSGRGSATDDAARAPELSVDLPTLPQQAALYRMSGDRHPIHLDPAAARTAGFDLPLLQGLCTWGMVAKAVVDHALDGDVAAISSYRARFAGPVFPGETLRLDIARRDGALHVAASVLERNAPALRGTITAK